MILKAQWTNDCQGKKDFDGHLVSLSTRYWPRGGGFHILTGSLGWEGNEARPDIKPSAVARILLRDGEGEDGDYEPLATFEVEAETEAEVKARVEEWAKEAFARVERALRAEFGGEPPDTPRSVEVRP